MPIVVGFVLLLTMLIMGLAFRSVVIAVVSSVLNLASVGVAFGLLTLVFQHGWFEGLLDFQSPGFVIDWLPMFILVVLVGLAAAILLDATVVRLVLLPAILTLLGDRAWGRGTTRAAGEEVRESDPAYQLVV